MRRWLQLDPQRQYTHAEMLASCETNDVNVYVIDLGGEQLTYVQGLSHTAFWSCVQEHLSDEDYDLQQHLNGKLVVDL